jgi:hypothetical protein
MSGILRCHDVFVDSGVNTKTVRRFVDDHVDIEISHPSNTGSKLATQIRIEGVGPICTARGHEKVKSNVLSTSLSKQAHNIGAKEAS